MGGRGREGKGRGTGRKGKEKGKGEGGESVPLALILQFDHWLHIDDSMHGAESAVLEVYITICCLQPTVMFLCSSWRRPSTLLTMSFCSFVFIAPVCCSCCCTPMVPIRLVFGSSILPSWFTMPQGLALITCYVYCGWSGQKCTFSFTGADFISTRRYLFVSVSFTRRQCAIHHHHHIYFSAEH